MKIFINPGHDSKRVRSSCIDPGAIHKPTITYEADICINIGNRVAEYLKMEGYEVELQQDDDLSSVVKYANNNKFDLFVSIHCNAYNGCVRGTEVWYYKGSNDGRELGRCIHKQIINRCGTVERGIKETDSLYVCRKTTMPAVLIETAFIDNDQDFQILYEHPELFAIAISDGIVQYIKNKED